MPSSALSGTASGRSRSHPTGRRPRCRSGQCGFSSLQFPSSGAGRSDAWDVVQGQLHAGHCVPAGEWLPRVCFRDTFGMRMWYRFWIAFTHFGFLLMFVRVKWVQTKIPCRQYPTRYPWRTERRTRPAEISKLAKKAKRGYTYFSGAE